ncbi:hypothetical protein [Ramlibacter albus]|uniref:Uncharacterized protein n=1 Tax=Ramlibacter albus TaxID=2079448 RepID=A0A923M9I5_9BURK|nr:hypothetical protein [Ramlibacter albus]MBC5765249.1 hypothetical protein [Ramlibacter albus]
MVLNPVTTYPQSRAFVLQLHRDADAGRMFGRLVHMTSGDSMDFADGDALLAWLAAALPLPTADNPGAPT